MKNKQTKMNKILLWLILTSVLMSVIGISMVHAQVAYSSYGNQPVLAVDLLNQNPDPARSGDTVDLHFSVENTGGAAVQNMTVELLQDYPFTVVSGNAVQNIGSIQAGQTGNTYQTFTYTVMVDKNNAQSERNVRIRYMYEGGTWITENFTINIANEEFAQIIYVDKSELNPGQETPITFTITNVGSAPLQNMVFSWREPTGAVLPVHSGATKYVKYLDVGQSIDLNYTVIADVNANPGLYPINMILHSESVTDATPVELNTTAGMFVGGETDFDVAFSESTAGQTSLSVSNIGNNPAQSVSVVVPQQPNFRVSGSNSAIIGNLNKGDYTLVSFQISSTAATNFTGQGAGQGRQGSAAQNATATRFRQEFGNNTFDNSTFGNAGRGNPGNLRVQIDYTDTTGNRRTVEKIVPIQFRSLSSSGATGTSFSGRSSSSSSFIGSTVFWIIIAVVVVGAGYFVYRKKTRAKKEKMVMSERRR